MKKILLFTLATLLPLLSFAQQLVKGVVTEKQSREPMIGVTVQIKGTTTGASTNLDGQYEINARKGDVLIFSYVGMTPYEVAVTNPDAPLNVALDKSSVAIEEVVAIGYGTQRKRDLSGSVASVKTKDIKAGVVTNAAQLLKGRAAGVHVRQNTSEPGGGVTIRVRGASSISSNNNPLYVIDGFQTDMGNMINPGDIESMEILKDAAATAIYGARGANGVIIITTKHGKKDQFAVEYGYDASLKVMHNPIELMDAQDIMRHQMKVWEDDGSGGNPPYTASQLAYKGAGTDWLEMATRNSLTQTHQVSLTGGGEKLQAAVSGNYTDDKGILSNTNFDRFSGRMNLTYKLSDRVRFGANTYISRANKNFVSMGTNSALDNMMYQLLMASPLSTPGKTNVFGETARPNHVLDELNSVKFESVSNMAYMSVNGEVDIFKFLTGRVMYAYSNNNDKTQKYYPKNTNIGKTNNGLATMDSYKTDNSQFDALLTYHQKIAKKLDTKVMVGGTYTCYKEEGNSISAKDFTTDAFSFNNLGGAKVVNSVGSYKVKKTNASFFMRGEFVWDNKYILNASFRADGASNFGKGNKWGYFPSISAAWQVCEEPFMEFAKPVLSDWKLRLSYGVTGNDGIGTYKSLAKFGTTQVHMGGNDNQIGIYPSSPSNPNLKWETTEQIDFGTDISLLNHRIDITFDYYVKTTRDLLNPINVSLANGGFKTMMANNGKIENRGFEFFIKSNNIAKPNFSWSTTLNLSRNRNKVLRLNEGEARYELITPHGWYNREEYLILQQGLPMSSIYGYVFKGIIQQGEKYDAQPDAREGDPKFADVNGDGIITQADRTVIGNGNPKVVLGLGNNFRIHNFDFSFFFDAALGHELLNLTGMVLEDNGRTISSTDRWTPYHASNRVPRFGYKKDAGMKYGSYINSSFVEDASYLRLSNIELGYTLPVEKLGNLRKYIKGLRIYIGAQNLFTITGYDGFDPETSTNGGNATMQGLDFNTYPTFRTFNFGAKIKF